LQITCRSRVTNSDGGRLAILAKDQIGVENIDHGKIYHPGPRCPPKVYPLFCEDLAQAGALFLRFGPLYQKAFVPANEVNKIVAVFALPRKISLAELHQGYEFSRP
jgi:hypothetical protein